MKNLSTRPLKILHLVSGDLWAGAEVMAFNLLRELSRYPDLEVAALVLNPGKLASLLKREGVSVHVLDEKALSLWQIVWQLRKVVAEFSPDLVHSHRYKENVLALLARTPRGFKTVSTQHGLPEPAAAPTAIKQRVKFAANFCLLSRFFSRTVAVSADLREVLVQRFGFSCAKVSHITNGVALPEFSSPRLRSGSFVIGSSGRLVPVKDYPLLLQIAEEMGCRGDYGVRVELAGDGPERPRLERMLAERGFGRGVLKGEVEDMGSFYRGLDIYVNTSVHEGIPMTVLEAMGWGLPVVAPAVGGIPEIVEDGVEGFLVRGRDAARFAEKCRLLRDDRGLWERMSKAARRKVVAEFSVVKMADSYRRLYRETTSIGSEVVGAG